MRAVLDTHLVIATDVPPLPGELAISVVTIAELHFDVLVTRRMGQQGQGWHSSAAAGGTALVGSQP